METKILTTHEISPAIRALKAGELVAFPTETVYGLGADGLSQAASEKIFYAKGRPADNPLILHVGGHDDLLPLVAGPLPAAAEKLIDAFWPGPLTVVVPARPEIPQAVRAGLNTVAVRSPSHPVARALIAGLGHPIAAPSANVSGRPSPTTAAAVWEDLKGRIAYIIDGGASEVGVESLVIDCTTVPPTILRPGGLDVALVEGIVGQVQQPSGDGPIRAPGMKYRHYAPNAPVIWIDTLDEAAAAEKIAELQRGYGTVAVLCRDNIPVDRDVRCMRLGTDDTSAAHQLFHALRTLDSHHPDALVVVWGESQGLGLAVRNRLSKAASERVVL